MLDNIKREIVAILAKMQVQPETDVELVEENMRQDAKKLEFHHRSRRAETILSKPEAHEKIEQHQEHPMCGAG